MARKPEKPVRERRITIPERAHPLAKLLYRLMKEHNMGYSEVEHRSGVLEQSFKAWRTRTTPGLVTIEATLGVFGWSVLAVPPLSDVPKEIRDELDVLAEKWEGINPVLCALLSTVSKTPLIHASAPPAIAPPRRARPPRKGAVLPGQTALFEDAA